MHDQFEIFPVEEFTDLSHGMTARSTRTKRKIELSLNGWEDYQPVKSKRTIATRKSSIALQPKTITN
jgi:hypothetical protein